ncbi:MAG: hypothetical protein IPM89_14510 [Candidatus Competibacteraceae bacterium]|nr:MAG: hypothetical protein IPM89_14510 [Candidatus Competibacteraceae bacterium]
MTDETQFLTASEAEMLAEVAAEGAETAEPTEPVEPTVEAEATAPEPAPTPDAVEPEAAPKPVPAPDPTQLQQATEALQRIDTQRDALAAQYESGEIGFSAYRAQERALERQARDAEGVLLQWQIETKVQQRQLQQNWDAAVTEFRQEPGAAAFESPVVLPMMQAALEAIRAKTPGLDAKSQLQQAKDAVQGQLRALLGVDSPVPTYTAQNSPARPRVAIPSLGSVPVAEANDSDLEFTHLGKLNGLALEKAVAKMSPDQRVRWLHS